MKLIETPIVFATAIITAFCVIVCVSVVKIDGPCWSAG
jgi:hypothetical protein